MTPFSTFSSKHPLDLALRMPTCCLVGSRLQLSNLFLPKVQHLSCSQQSISIVSDGSMHCRKVFTKPLGVEILQSPQLSEMRSWLWPSLYGWMATCHLPPPSSSPVWHRVRPPGLSLLGTPKTFGFPSLFGFHLLR